MKAKRTKAKPAPNKTPIQHVAVIISKDALDLEAPFGCSASRREQGDWACFVGTDRDQVIAEALKARNKWDKHDEYDIVIGQLSGMIQQNVRYTLRRI